MLPIKLNRLKCHIVIYFGLIYSKGHPRLTTAQPGLHTGETPTVQPGLNTGETPTAQPGLHTGKTPTATPGHFPGGTTTAQPGLQTGIRPTAHPGLPTGETPTAKPGLHTGETPTAQPGLHTGETPTAKPGLNTGETPTAQPPLVSGQTPLIHVTPTSSGLVCNHGWTDLMSIDNPSDGDDLEPMDELRKKYKFCDDSHVIIVECVGLYTGKSADDMKEKAVCDMKNGFKCYGADQTDGKCEDYAVRVYCDCRQSKF